MQPSNGSFRARQALNEVRIGIPAQTPSLPALAHDVPVDVLVTEEGVLRPRL